MVAPELLWTPTAERAEQANITAYQRWLESEHGLAFADYEALWRWSVADLESFWDSIAKFAGVTFERPASRVLGSRGMPGAEWFPGAYVNYAEHIVAGKRDEDVAIRFASELRELDSWTWAALREQAAAIAAGPASRSASARAIASPRTCRTSPRRSRRSSRSRRSARSGPRRRPSSAPAA